VITVGLKNLTWQCLDPDSLNPDPDPGYAESGDPDPDQEFLLQNLEKFTVKGKFEKTTPTGIASERPKEDIQALGGAFSPLERYSNIKSHIFSVWFAWIRIT
jgi:hypothetical protein